MTITEKIENHQGRTFSFEVLPPLKGKGIDSLFQRIEKLIDYDPAYINITTHRSEVVFKSTADGLYRKVSERSRPGTVAVAAAIQNRYRIEAVPHLICSGYSRLETEYALIDLNFLGITNLLLLRGDKAKHDSRFVPNVDGHAHASELQSQVNAFNEGLFIDGTPMDSPLSVPFSYGVAAYPEKHEESPNMELDLMWLKAKVDAGATYAVTQMFFDNNKYFKFVEMAREVGINVPIIPGIKPITSLAQLTVLPKVFKVDFPSPLASALMACKTDAEARQVGVEWCIAQARELYEHGVKSIHFYSHNATDSVEKVVADIFK
ncbi:MAG: methylenetetrahydrofolate reductase [NAD(P)H] [Muribaculaceae bacterium]|nr:methylenetetrahydrofolate reductase [NAD(P)H] [Muribaculaceae bacterium]